MVLGLKVNFFKSKLYEVSIKEAFLKATSHFLSCNIDIVPFKYLCILVGCNPRRCEMWKPLISSLNWKFTG